MAIDIKKVLTSLKERKETMLVWGLGAIAFALGAFFLFGYLKGAPPPPSRRLVVKGEKPLVSKEERAEAAVAELKRSQKIPPFIDYQDILTKNLFIQSRTGANGEEKKVGIKDFQLKGIFDYGRGDVAAFINDPAGQPHLVRVGQMIGTSEVKVVAIDFKNQSVALLGKGMEKPQVIRSAGEKIEEERGLITYKPSEEKREIEKPKEAPEKPGETPEKPEETPEAAAKKAIASAKRAISKVDKAIVDASSTEADTSEAVEKRDVAQEKLTRAQEVSLTKEYAQAKELALEAEKLAKEAVFLMEEAEIEEAEIEEEEEEK